MFDLSLRVRGCDCMRLSACLCLSACLSVCLSVCFASVLVSCSVRELHREFLRSGADVMQSFTFYASDDKLENRANKAAVHGVSTVLIGQNHGNDHVTTYNICVA